MIQRLTLPLLALFVLLSAAAQADSRDDRNYSQWRSRQGYQAQMVRDRDDRWRGGYTWRGTDRDWRWRGDRDWRWRGDRDWRWDRGRHYWYGGYYRPWGYYGYNRTYAYPYYPGYVYGPSYYYPPTYYYTYPPVYGYAAYPDTDDSFGLGFQYGDWGWAH